MDRLNVLWEYQILDLEKERLEREVLTTPARGKMKKLHGFLSEQQNAIARLQKELEQKDAELTRIDEQIIELERQIDLEGSELEQMMKDEECTAEEFTECRESYQKLQSDVNVARRELAELVKWLEQAMEEYKATRQRASRAKKEYDQVKLVCEQEAAAQKGAIDAANLKLVGQAKRIDEKLLSAYKRVKKNHAVPVAKVENNQCGGCNMSLPSVVVKRVANNTDIVECENCGRILFAGDE